MPETIELKPRRKPAQKRGEKTYNHILDVSSDLLEEVGLDNFNTNLIAEHANVRVATIYRYFPNKLAILSTLVERWLQLTVDSTTFVSDLGDPNNDWREIFAKFIDVYVAIVLSQKGHLAIRRAVIAAPELRQIEARMVKRLSVAIVHSLKTRGVQFSNHQMLNFVEVSMSATAQVIDMAMIKGKKRKASFQEIVAEAKLLQQSYLANYLD
jgi:AcrR family transcriptional regulator